MVCAGPLDWWAGIKGRWIPIEMKAKNGRYTPFQKKFLAQCELDGLPVWTWRTTDDVLRDLRTIRNS